MLKTEQEVLEKFGEGFDCSQVVLRNVHEKLGITEEEALKIGACFGGGMWHGETCGCVVGALATIGIKYATTKPNDQEAKDKLLKIKAEFEEEFCKKNGSCICKEILGYNLSVPEEMEKIQEEKLLETKCPKVVLSACEILEKMI